MTEQRGTATIEEAKDADRRAAYGLTAPARPPAIAADGELVGSTEIEAAATLMRMTGRLGLAGHRINGFRLFRAYRAYRGLRRALSAVLRRDPSRLG